MSLCRLWVQANQTQLREAEYERQVWWPWSRGTQLLLHVKNTGLCHLGRRNDFLTSVLLVCFLKIFVYFAWDSLTERGRERQRFFFPSGDSLLRWLLLPKLGARSKSQVCHVSAGDERCGHTWLLSQARSRKLYWKWRSQGHELTPAWRRINLLCHSANQNQRCNVLFGVNRAGWW